MRKRKLISMLLAAVLLITNIPFVNAWDIGETSLKDQNVSVTDSVYQFDAAKEVDLNNLITISSITEQFGVSRQRVIEELAKGYQLHEIYQGLLHEQQGASYEAFMQNNYSLPANNPLIENMKLAEATSVTDSVYLPTVTESVYKEHVSVTDSVYYKSFFARSSSNPYDDVALKRRKLKYDQAPYAVGSVNDHISTVDGSLRIEVTDLEMPGPNGMDFKLKRIYDSSSAKDDLYTYLQYGYLYRNATTSTEDETMFPIGKGWIWDISHVSSVNSEPYLYISGVGKFKLSGNMNLIGYPWNNLSFGYATEADKVEVEGAEFVLQNYTTGIHEFFSDTGKLIYRRDAHGNWIKLLYERHLKYGEVLVSVLSSSVIEKGGNLNRMWFRYSNDKVEVGIGAGDRRVTYVKGTKNTNSRTQEVLTEVIDSVGRSTKYDYYIWKDLKFNLVKDYKQYEGNKDLEQDFWGSSEVILLSTIEHPTKAITKYTFALPARRNIGEYAVEENARYNGKEDFYSSARNTSANKVYIQFLQDIGDSRYTHTFQVKVNDNLTETVYTHKKVESDADTPTTVYTEKIETQAIGASQKRIVENKYNESSGRAVPIKITESSYDSGRWSPTRYSYRTYDDYGFVTSETDPLGTTNSYQYQGVSGKNIFAMVSSTISAANNDSLHTTNKYDDNGSLKQTLLTNSQGNELQQINYDYDLVGNPETIRIEGDQKDTVVKQKFDPRFKSFYLSEQDVQVSNVDGAVTTIGQHAEYEPYLGLVLKTIDGNGNETNYTYDKLGRATSERYADGSQTSIVYDDTNNKISVTDPVGNVSVMQFDPLGQLIEESNGRGIAKHGYDEFGRIIRKGDFNDSFVMYKYDAWGRVIEEKPIYYEGTRYQYDDAANTKTIIDGANNTLKETYDILGRLILKEEVKPTGNTVLSRYEYDRVGNVIKQIDGNNNTTTYTYDAQNRLTAVTDAEGKTTRYAYNLAGDVVEVRYADGNIVRKSYDEIGRLTKQIDPQQQAKKYYYDGNSNVVKSIDRAGQVHEYRYNNRDLMITDSLPDGSVSYSYDASGKRTAMTDETGSTSYSYYPSGELAGIQYPDHTKLSFDYDARSMRTTQTITAQNHSMTMNTKFLSAYPTPSLLTVKDGSGSKLEEFTYSFDRLTRRMSGISSTSGLSETYNYDGFNLAGIQQNQNNAGFAQYTYNYDNNRNIVAKNDNGVAHQFSYDPLNRIKTSSQFNEAYTYDQRDNRSTLQSDQVPNIKGASYAYDSRNRLTKVTTEDGKAVSYRYNGDNLMVERTENGVTTRYYYDDRAKIVAEGRVEGNGSITITAAYVHDSNGKLLARQVPGQGMQYYVSNGHGDITEIRDTQGNVLNRYTYDIWGNPLVQEEQVPNIFRYSGEYWDAATNLQYLRARWYDPSVGRFINEDTYEGDINDPLSLNLYTYVSNNPLIKIDPSGHDAVVITNPKLAMGAGHTSLLLQNSTGDWSYFYYGDYSVQFRKVPTSALTDLKSFNEWGAKEKLSGFGSGGYQYSTYIKGDFTKAYSSATTMEESYEKIKGQNGQNPEYNLITCSCFTNSKELLSSGILHNGVSMKKFMASVTAKEAEYAGLVGTKTPNIGKAAIATTFYNDAFTFSDYVSQLNANKESYGEKNWFMKKLHQSNFHIYRINILLGNNS